jgi:N-acetylmuramoyl-L-alanine amidase
MNHKRLKTVFLLLLFIISTNAYAEELIIIRGSKKGERLDIVLQSAGNLILSSKFEKDKNTLSVTLNSAKFKVKSESLPVEYIVENNKIIFKTGEVNNFNGFFLQSPTRLVINVTLTQQSSKNSNKKTVSAIVIDAGHGGDDSGIVKDAFSEKNVALAVSKKIEQMLKKRNLKVFLTRNNDSSLSLLERKIYAKSKGPSLFISLHIGTSNKFVIITSSATKQIDGLIEQYLIYKGQSAYLKSSASFSESMGKAFKLAIVEYPVVLLPIPHTVLEDVEAAAIIIEMPSFNNATYNEAFYERIARTIIDGIDLYDKEGLY